MGITEQGLEFLLAAKNWGVSFERTMTLGRQWLLVSPERFARTLGGPPPAGVFQDGYADGLFVFLGARQVRSVDVSDFEGATDVHDLNDPISEALKGRFSAVIDGGCLEHVFDFPTAMRNVMEMVEVGGHLLSISPTNNASGHGFYQFSPDLFFRVLSPENGFTVERMLMSEVHPDAPWYEVVDPAVVAERAEVTNHRELYLYVRARRTRDVRPFGKAPVQSYYQHQWQHLDESGLGATHRPTSVDLIKSLIRRNAILRVPAEAVLDSVRKYRDFRRPFDPEHFRPLGRPLQDEPR